MGRRIDQWAVPSQSRFVRREIGRTKPALVHALRIPYEGIAAARAVGNVPFIVSSWGQDFVHHALDSEWVKSETHRTLRHARGFTADCERDARLAPDFGYTGEGPLLVPGNGGIDTKIFHPVSSDLDRRAARVSLSLPPEGVIAINPRGVRSFVRTREFIDSLAIAMREDASLSAILVDVAKAPEFQARVQELGLSHRVRVTGHLSQRELSNLFAVSDVVCSPSTSDGSPNSVMEAIVSGCYPVVGDIDCARDLVVAGQTGELVDPTDPASIAAGLIRAATAVRSTEFSQRSRSMEQFSRSAVSKQIGDYYERVLAGTPGV